MRAHPVVLCLQDTTELDFNGQGLEGDRAAELQDATRHVLAPDVCREPGARTARGVGCVDVGTGAER